MKLLSNRMTAIYRHYVNGQVCYAAIWETDRDWMELGWQRAGILFEYETSMTWDEFLSATQVGQFRPICGEEGAPVPPPIEPQPEPPLEPRRCIIATVFLGEQHFLLPPMRLFRDKIIPRPVMEVYYGLSVKVLRKIGRL